jgi:hypothetical protein
LFLISQIFKNVEDDAMMEEGGEYGKPFSLIARMTKSKIEIYYKYAIC